MCLILFAWQSHPRYPLVVAANRDEFHDRPTQAADFWVDHPNILAGRDTQANGTWLGVSRDGRFAAISNYREPVFQSSPLEYSRGHLVRDFLLSDSPPATYSEHLQMEGNRYRGFNLLVGDSDKLTYVSNRVEKPVNVEAGIHGLSNHLLDTDWPKVHTGRIRLAELLINENIDPQDLLDLLADSTPVSKSNLPVDELVTEPEEMTKRIFIRSPVYGTRSSTVLLVGRNGETTFVERQFDAGCNPTGTRSFQFK